MKPIKEALDFAKQRCIDDPDDLLYRQHYMQLQTIHEQGIAFEVIQDYDWQVVQLRTLGMSYHLAHEMSFEFKGDDLLKYSRYVAEYIQAAILSAVTFDDFNKDLFPNVAPDEQIIAALNKSDLFEVKPDDYGLRVIKPNCTHNPCYGDEEYANVCYIVTAKELSK